LRLYQEKNYKGKLMSNSTLKPTLAMFVAGAVFIAAAPAMATNPTYDVNNQPMSFFALNAELDVNAPDSETEVLHAADASTTPVRYENVITISGTEIDALVSVVDLLNSGSREDDNDEFVIEDDKLSRIDNINLSEDDEQANELESSFYSYADDGDEAYAIVDIQFVLGGTTTAVTLTNVSLSISDIDNDQFVQFSGLSSYSLSPDRLVNRYDETTPDDWDSIEDEYPTQVTAVTGEDTLETSNEDSVNVSVPAGSVFFFASSSSGDFDDEESPASKDLFVSQVAFEEVSTIRAKFGTFSYGYMTMDFAFQPYANFEDATVVTVTQPSFTITYDANTGTGTPPAATSGVGGLTVGGSLTSPGITKPGFVFAGWNTRPDGTGVAYAPGSSILPVANLTLYAVWTPAPVLAKTGTETVGPLGLTLGLVATGAALLGVRRILKNKTAKTT
jgi:uncharacterized repeat protein (TIGR02543 family)